MSNNRLHLDYCASSFLPSFRFGNGCKNFVDGIAKHLIYSNQFLQNQLNLVTISGLYNGFSEEHFIARIAPDDLKELFPNFLYSDSGGLQQARMNEKFSEETKRAIYFQQSKANFSFAFDELPFENVNNSMVFRPERVSECGTQAGRNLKEQIEYFDEINAGTSPIGIVQGGTDLDSLSTYTQNMLGQLDDHRISDLKCLALGGVIWLNPVDTLLKSVQTLWIDGVPDRMRKHFHILGITGREKLIPILILAKNKNGLFKNVERLSFDSTTMTQSWLFGNIHPSLSDLKGANPKRNLGKFRDEFVETHYAKIFQWWQQNPQNIFTSPEDLLDHSVFNTDYPTAAKQYERGVEHSIKTIVQKMAFVNFNTANFFGIVEGYMNGDIELHDFLQNDKRLPLWQALEQVRDFETFGEWVEVANNR